MAFITGLILGAVVAGAIWAWAKARDAKAAAAEKATVKPAGDGGPGEIR